MKSKGFDKSLYPSVCDAIHEIMNNHLLVGISQPIYNAKALEEICFFLAANNIQHEYVIVPAPIGAEFDEVISLVWKESNVVGNEVWYSCGKAEKHTYHARLVIRADSLDKVEDWVSTLTYDNIEIDIEDWSVEEV